MDEVLAMPPSKGTVAYFGSPSSNTHQAAIKYFGESEYTLKPQASIRDVFTAVRSSTAEHGVVPFENSTYGPVVDTLDALAALPASSGTAEVVVCGEICLPIHHCLLGRQPTLVDTSDESGQTRPAIEDHAGAIHPPTPCSLSDVQHVYSHPQALGQCKLFLTKFLPNAKLHEAASTSQAAQLVARDSAHSAAIASRTTATTYHLEILAENIEDREDNATRFLILRRNVAHEADSRVVDHKIETHKCLVCFTIDQERPGTLVNFLSVLPKYGLNLTSIHSRPSPDRPWQYVFFIEFKTIRGVGAVNEAWSELVSTTKELTWLGSWDDRLDEQSG